MDNPNSLVGQQIERAGVGLFLGETQVSRGKAAGEKRIVVLTDGVALDRLVSFIGEDNATDYLAAAIRRASLDADSACWITTKDTVSGVERKNYDEANYVDNFIAALEGSAGEGEKALKEQRDTLNAEFINLTTTKFVPISMGLLNEDIGPVRTRLEELKLKLDSLNEQIAAKAAAREAKAAAKK